MALHELHFEFKVDHPVELRKSWTHTGVVGSGDMEVLMEKKDLEGGTRVKVVTPAKGFERVWGLILGKFIRESRLGNVFIEINDNYASPLVASTRLSQALADAKESELEG
jgi:malonate decarboxylase delta subunit